MKHLLLIMLVTLSVSGQAQTTRISGDTLFSSGGMPVVINQKIKLGLGTMPDGNFKFIRINSHSIFHNSEVSNYNTGFNANNANSLNRRESGKEYRVIRLEKRGDEEHGYTYYAVVAGTPRYEVDIENAILSGELQVPAQYKPVAASQTSVADELIKFKKLYDDGALTKEEYTARKKKLLEKE